MPLRPPSIARAIVGLFTGDRMPPITDKQFEQLFETVDEYQAAMLDIWRILDHTPGTARFIKDNVRERLLRAWPGITDALVKPISIENSDPIADMLRSQGLCHICENPLDTDTGFCTHCGER